MTNGILHESSVRPKKRVGREKYSVVLEYWAPYVELRIKSLDFLSDLLADSEEDERDSAFVASFSDGTDGCDVHGVFYIATSGDEVDVAS
jgi:hypothetical protein